MRAIGPLLAAGALAVFTAPTQAQSPLDGLGLRPPDANNPSWSLMALGDLDAPAFEFWQVVPTRPAAGTPATHVDASQAVIFRDGRRPDAKVVALMVTRTMGCAPGSIGFTVTKVITYGADGSVLSESKTIPAALESFAPSDDYHLVDTAFRCQPSGRQPSGTSKTIAVEMVRPVEKPTRSVTPAEAAPVIRDVSTMIAWGKWREADIARARALSPAGRFVVTPGERPVIVDLGNRKTVGEEERVTVIQFADKETGWYMRATGRVNCQKQTVVPEQQADYDAAGALRGFRRLDTAEYAMPGKDSYGAMFAPVCLREALANTQSVYATLPEAISAARKSDRAGNLLASLR